MRVLVAIVLCSLLISGCEGAARAIAYFGESNYVQQNVVGGSVTFDQATVSDDVILTGSITGLAAYSIHAFHVHITGDSRDKTSTFTTHFNPDGSTHGAPPMSVRHNGDMGNITADASGVVTISLTIGQSKMSLFAGAVNSIIGRAAVVHPLWDQGAGTSNGNAGSPYAFGKIGIANIAGMTNEAGPSDGLTFAISNHVGLGSQIVGGSLWLQVTNGIVTLYTNFSGFIPKGHYQIGFYDYGDQLLTSRNSGPLITATGHIDVTNTGPTCHNLTITDIGDLIGRMSILFTDAGVAYPNIVSMGVVSVANSAVPFVNPSAQYVCTGPAGAWTDLSGASGVRVFGVWAIVAAVGAVLALIQ